MAPPISILMTTYNRERYLGAAIESVLAQTCGDFELLLWDDGATDRSVALARDYTRQDARVRVVAAPHLGCTPALKAAVAHAAGTYVGLVDSDDLLAPTALEETMAILDAQPEVGMSTRTTWISMRTARSVAMDNAATSRTPQRVSC